MALVRLAFLTSTPLDVRRGSGTFVGIDALARALEALGVDVTLVAPRRHCPVYTLERLAFNERLRRRPPGGFDAVVGFDMDGWRIAGRGGAPHIAALKGVAADELRFQKGLTRATMAVQARCEAVHARRADRVITTSRYAAERARDCYRLRETPAIVPELIDLAEWRRYLAAHAGAPESGRFTVLTVCRLYRRKRIDVLLGAAARLRGRIAGLQFRIVGDGPEAGEFRAVWQREGLQDLVHFLGDVPRGRLAEEYRRADLFCLPSVQEGFGIVFLEAMAAGLPVVAARAAAAPEVVQGVLVEPDNPEALAASLAALHDAPAQRAALSQGGTEWVRQFDAPSVARRFLAAIFPEPACYRGEP